MEDLKGIRTRAKVRHGERGVLHSWGFSQFGQMIAYKAALAGVLVELVDPRHTSRTCSKCGDCEKGNRGNQSEFRCRLCGREAHADLNATENIRQGRSKEAERDVVENRLSQFVSLQAAFRRSHKPSPLGEGGLLTASVVSFGRREVLRLLARRTAEQIDRHFRQQVRQQPYLTATRQKVAAFHHQAFHAHQCLEIPHR
jgi:hypothetical protein